MEKKLERIGVDLDYNKKDELEISWNTMYKRYQTFIKKHGHTIGTSSKHGPQSTRQLYQWLRWQIDLKKENKLTKKREMLLANVNSLWHLSNFEVRWYNKLQEFIDFKKKQKGQYISWNTNSPLRGWLRNQKVNFNKLPIEKKKLFIKAGAIKFLKKAGTRHSPYRENK